MKITMTEEKRELNRNKPWNFSVSSTISIDIDGAKFNIESKDNEWDDNQMDDIDNYLISIGKDEDFIDLINLWGKANLKEFDI